MLHFLFAISLLELSLCFLAITCNFPPYLSERDVGFLILYARAVAQVSYSNANTTWCYLDTRVIFDKDTPGAQEKEKSKVGLTLFILESESVTICYQQPELEISTRFAASSTYSFWRQIHG